MKDARRTGSSTAKALDALPAGGGSVTIDGDGTSTEVDVVDVDRIGVRVRGVKVSRDADVDVVAEVDRLPREMRALPDRIAPVEVDAGLGGGRLRTRPDDLRGGEFFEVDVRPRETTIHRTRIEDDGTRAPTDWTMTREQLDKLIDEATGP